MDAKVNDARTIECKIEREIEDAIHELVCALRCQMEYEHHRDYGKRLDSDNPFSEAKALQEVVERMEQRYGKRYVWKALAFYIDDVDTIPFHERWEKLAQRV